jgi:ferritin-like metal-binding protein YciE
LTGQRNETQTLRDLYIDELKDLYDAENRLIKVLPKVARLPIPRFGSEPHLEQTKEPSHRLKHILTAMDEKAGKKCPGNDRHPRRMMGFAAC